MKRTHLFFPENDLALALNLENYTPPPAAARLRHAGEALPLWYGADGDSFIATGTNARWLRTMQELFGMDVNVYNYDPTGSTPAPWGWSKASRRMYASRGFSPASLPDDQQLERIRALSHRRTAAMIAQRLTDVPGLDSVPAARECSDIEEILRIVDTRGEVLLKLPWSSSGRGLVKVDRHTVRAQSAMIAGMIKRQGSVMVEDFYGKTLDFAMLFTMHNGHCRYDGLSLFSTDRLGSYTGNALAPQAVLGERIGSATVSILRSVLPAILEEIIGRTYNGPLGIDMMNIADGRVDAAVELNLRMTMGHLCLRLYERYIRPGAEGYFLIIPSNEHPGSAPPDISGGRLRGGTLHLNPPGTDFNFMATIKG